MGAKTTPMYKSSLLLGLCLFLIIKSFSQINYGKEDCGSLFKEWVDALNEAKINTGSAFDPSGLQIFYLWTELAKKDIKEARFKILLPVRTDDNFYRSVITLLNANLNSEYEHSAIKSFSNIAGFMDDIDTISMATRQLVQSMNFLFRANRLEIGLNKMHQYKDSSYLPVPILEDKKYGTFSMNSFYKHLIDYVEYGTERPLDIEGIYFYEANYKQFYAITGAVAPSSNELYKEYDMVEEYLRFFAKDLLYAYARYYELIDALGGPPLITLPAAAGTKGPNRYDPKYYKKLFGNIYSSSLSTLITHIENIAKSCAATPLSTLGKINFTTAFEEIPQKESGEAPLNPKKMEKGYGRLLVIQKNADGSFVDDEDRAMVYDMTVTPNVWRNTISMNWYTDVLPGKYKVRSPRPAHDSGTVELPEGQTRIIRFPAKGSLSVKLINRLGNTIPVHSTRIEILKQNNENSYKTDTAFFDLVNGDAKPREMNPGNYRLGIRFPEKYFPSFIYVEEPIEVKAKTNTAITVTGFGDLVLTAYSGTGQIKKDMRAEILTPEKNTKTKNYTWLVYIMNRDTLHMRPGKFLVKVNYPFNIFRQVEIKNGEIKELTLDNLGSLIVNRGKAGYDRIEITDNMTKEMIGLKNNTTIDVETDRTYTIKIVGTGNIKSKIFENVEIKTGELTTINW